MTFSFFFKITLVIIRVWVTNSAQTANGIFQTSISPTYKPLSKIYARRVIPVKLFYHTFSHFSAFMRADFFNVRLRARWVLARTRTYTSARLARAHARTPATYPSEGNSGLEHPQSVS